MARTIIKTQCNPNQLKSLFGSMLYKNRQQDKQQDKEIVFEIHCRVIFERSTLQYTIEFLEFEK